MAEPATVAVPAAATVPTKVVLPATIPAGDESPSSAPLWALVLMAVGILGAVVSAARIAGARR